MITLTLALLIAGLPAPQAGISGTVRTSDGTPIVNARVTLETSPASPPVLTGVRGEFALPAAPLPANVTVQAPGFAPFRRAVTASPVDIVLVPASVTESVVVTADRQSAWRDPRSGATVLTAGDLGALPAVTLDEALRQVAGLSLFRRSSSRASNPTTHGVTMRGLSASGASRGLVLVDGVPLNDGFGGWVTWTRMPPLAIERVDVERGAAGDAFGSDALGGAIRIVTPAAASRVVTAGIQAGSLATVEIDASAGEQLGRVSIFGATSWFRTDGAIPLAAASRGAIDRPADADWISMFGRAELAADGQRLVFSGWGGRDDRGNGTERQRNRMAGGTVAVAADLAGSRTTAAVRVALSPNRFDQTFSTIAAGRATETVNSTQRVDGNTIRLTAEAGRSFARAHVLGRATLNRADATFEDRRPASTTKLSLRDHGEAISVHAGATPHSRVSLGGGLRQEWRAAPDATSARRQATVGHASAAVDVGLGVAVRASAAASHRWPTLNELVRNFQVGAIVTQANPDLAPERARSYDVAATVTRPLWMASVTAFGAVVDAAIANVTITPTLRRRGNAGEAHAHGVEVDAEVRPLPTLRLRVSASMVNARFRNSLEAPLEGKRLPQVPRGAVAITGDYHPRPWIRLTMMARSVGAQFDDDRNTFELVDATQVDARVSGERGRIGWHLTADNLFNARVEVGRTPLVTLAPPRAVRVGVTFRFR